MNATRSEGLLLGREDAIRGVLEAVRAGRLVTITGGGGVGKSRLAAAAAEQLHDDFVACFVDFVSLPAGSDVRPLLATTVAAARQASADPRLAVAGTRILVVLDTCEHVRESCADTLAALLDECPDITVLATSREPIGIAAERQLQLTPLDSPESDSPLTLDSFGEIPAVALFRQRVLDVRPDFIITAAVAPGLALLLARLDGNPLAIAMAAGWLRIVSIEQLLTMTADLLDLRAPQTGEFAPRHRSVHAVAAWSHRGCAPIECEVWAAVSVFSGTFDLSAAQDVAAGMAIASGEVLSALERLVARSILRVDHSTSPPRFRLPMMMRDFGRRELARRGVSAAVRDRHLDHYAEAALDPQGGAPDGVGGTVTSDDEANAIAALDHAVDSGDAERTLVLATSLREHWIFGSLKTAAPDYVERVLCVGVSPSPLLVEMLLIAAARASGRGDQNSAKSALGAGRRLSAELKEPYNRDFETLVHGTLALIAGDAPNAIRRFRDCVPALEDRGAATLAAWGRTQRAMAHAFAGEFDNADTQLESVLSAEVGASSWMWVDAVASSSLIRLMRGDEDIGEDDIVAALCATPSRGIDVVRGGAIAVSAVAAARQERHHDAARLIGAAEQQWHNSRTRLEDFGPLFLGPIGAARERSSRALGFAQFGLFRAQGFALGLDVFRHLDQGAALRKPVAQSQPGAANITPREYEVAELVSQGLTNRVIAERMFVSPRTVDGHLERLFRKLGLTNRTAIAVWVASAAPPAPR